jgi:hypothetical protein
MMLDRQTWRLRAQHAIERAFKALESGRLPFGNWERLFLSAAIDHFRDRNFEQSATSAQRALSEHQRPPFAGHFTQEKSLADLRAEYEVLARLERGYPGSTGF